MVQNNQDFEFRNSLSTLIDFYLDSIQNQLNMISPILNDQQTETVITSPEVTSNKYASEVKIIVPFQSNIEDTGIFDFSKAVLDRFSNLFSGKVELNKNSSSYTTENVNTSFIVTTEESISEDLVSKDILNTTNSSVSNSTQKTSTTPKDYDLYNAYGSENPQDNETSSTDSVSVISLIENSNKSTLFEDTLASTTIGILTTTSKPLNLKNTSDEHLNSTKVDFNEKANDEKSTPKNSTLEDVKNPRSKRSYKYFFSLSGNVRYIFYLFLMSLVSNYF